MAFLTVVRCIVYLTSREAADSSREQVLINQEGSNQHGPRDHRIAHSIN
jgi:hypothetical protein